MPVPKLNALSANTKLFTDTKSSPLCGPGQHKTNPDDTSFTTLLNNNNNCHVHTVDRQLVLTPSQPR